MQTFLPYADFAQTASSLDQMRLGKQRVETFQIMKALLGGGGWQNHPATLMWKGYERALLSYQEAICAEWTSRGYKDTTLEKTRDLFQQHRSLADPVVMPPWHGVEAFHKSHRSNLLRKNAAFYSPKFEQDLTDDLPYYWPTKISSH